MPAFLSLSASWLQRQGLCSLCRHKVAIPLRLSCHSGLWVKTILLSLFFYLSRRFVTARRSVTNTPLRTKHTFQINQPALLAQVICKLYNIVRRLNPVEIKPQFYFLEFTIHQFSWHLSLLLLNLFSLPLSASEIPPCSSRHILNLFSL